MKDIEKLSANELVDEFYCFLRDSKKGGGSYPVDSRGGGKIQYHVFDYIFSIDFQKDGWRYKLEVEHNNSKSKIWSEVPYSGSNKPNFHRLFEDNMAFGRKLTNSE